MGNQISSVKDLNIGIDAKTRLKDNIEVLKKNSIDNNGVKVYLNERSDSVVYNKNGYINQELDIGRKISDKMIDASPADGPSVGEVAKEVGLSAIPIYGTIREFQKGNIGWGIFGIVTDALSLIPVIGVGAKALGTAIRGGSAAIRAARVGLAAAEVTSKMTTATVAKQFAVGSSEGLAKAGKDLGKAALCAVDPGVELLYKGGKLITSGTAKIVTAPTKAAVAVKSAIAANLSSNFSKWKNLPSSVVSSGSEAVDILQKGFYKIKSTDKLDEQFIVDFPRAKYKINGKVISRGNTNEFVKLVPDLKKRQLISAYANQTVLADLSVNVMSSAADIFTKYGAHNSKVSYEIKDISNGGMKLIAKNESYLEPIDSLIKEEKKYFSYGIKTEMILSENKLPAPKYSYYIR